MLATCKMLQPKMDQFYDPQSSAYYVQPSFLEPYCQIPLSASRAAGGTQFSDAFNPVAMTQQNPVSFLPMDHSGGSLKMISDASRSVNPSPRVVPLYYNTAQSSPGEFQTTAALEPHTLSAGNLAFNQMPGYGGVTLFTAEAQPSAGEVALLADPSSFGQDNDTFLHSSLTGGEFMSPIAPRLRSLGRSVAQGTQWTDEQDNFLWAAKRERRDDLQTISRDMLRTFGVDRTTNMLSKRYARLVQRYSSDNVSSAGPMIDNPPDSHWHARKSSKQYPMRCLA